MYISARERKILEFLLDQEEGTTASDIAGKMGVSSRTVHRDLKGVEDILAPFQLSINKKSGIGIQIIGDQGQKQQLTSYFESLSHNEFTPDERQTIILSALLGSSEPVKLLALANELNVTIATISNDLNRIEELIQVDGLSLIRKRGYGVELQGDESAKRRVMSSLILDSLDEVEFLSIIKGNIQRKASSDVKTNTDQLLGFVDKSKLQIIEKQIEKIKNGLPYSIADSAYIGLVVHLALAIERIIKGEKIKFDQSILESMLGTIEFEKASEIACELEKVFDVHIPEGEIGYITTHLLGAKLRHDKDFLFDEKSEFVVLQAAKLIKIISGELEIDLSENQSLLQGLAAHLRPALYRMEQHLGIDNPLLSQVKHDYQELFEVIMNGVKRIFPDLAVPEEEIGFLVMHFASAFIKKNAKKEINALVICSSGIGTSKILATMLAREFTEMNQIKTISYFEIDHVNLTEFDLVVSTIPIKELEGEYSLVSPILTKTDIQKIKTKIETIKPVMKKVEVSEKDFLPRLKTIQHFSATIITILEQFSLKYLNNVSRIDEALKEACQFLKEQGSLLHTDEVVEALLNREKSGGVGIPGTTLALYHTRSEAVVKPVFTIFQVSESLTIKAMDDTKIAMDTILLLLSPVNPNNETLEVLSHISASIIQDAESIKLFESGNKEQIYDYVNSELNRFFETKLH